MSFTSRAQCAEAVIYRNFLRPTTLFDVVSLCSGLMMPADSFCFETIIELGLSNRVGKASIICHCNVLTTLGIIESLTKTLVRAQISYAYKHGTLVAAECSCQAE